MTRDEITSFITGHRWKFAKTMPESPHWYVVKEKCRSITEFEQFVIYIRKHGYREKYQRNWYTVLDHTIEGQEPMKYWTMGWPVEQTVIINRAVKR